MRSGLLFPPGIMMRPCNSRGYIKGFPEQLLKKEFNYVCLWFLLVLFYCLEREGREWPNKENLKRLLLITDFYLPHVLSLLELIKSRPDVCQMG